VQWPSFFQLPVLMLMLITLLNDGTLISIGYDNVVPNPRPDMWNLKVWHSLTIAVTIQLYTSYVALGCHSQSPLKAACCN
jgi:hypothetical protein